jgi:hypothetical protein
LSDSPIPDRLQIPDSIFQIPRAFVRARVGFLVDLDQPPDVDVRVALGGREPRVAQELLDRA